MSGFTHQDWNTVDVGNRGSRIKPDKQEALKKAKRTGSVVSIAKTNQTNSTKAGVMATSGAINARKIEEETESFNIQKTGLTLGKAIQQGRTAKKLTQKQLAVSLNEKPQVIQQYENGQAIPNPQIINKIERALGVKLPRKK